VAKLGLREKVEDGGGQQVRRGVTIDFERLWVFFGQDPYISVVIERPSQIDQIAIGFGDQSGVGKTRTDGPGNFKGRGAFGDVLASAVRKSEMNAIRHK
jgi:hypothetical protein